MIMTVDELRQNINTQETDSLLAAKLEAIEQLIRTYTNNNFQKINFRVSCNASVNGLEFSSNLFREGDTVQVSESHFNDGLYTIDSIDLENGCMRLNRTLYDEQNVLVTKVEYPTDIKLGVVNMIKWDLDNRSKVGIQSETLSRHSVTYFNMDGDNSKLGYPKSLVGFLKPYRKPRF